MEHTKPAKPDARSCPHCQQTTSLLNTSGVKPSKRKRRAVHYVRGVRCPGSGEAVDTQHYPGTPRATPRTHAKRVESPFVARALEALHDNPGMKRKDIVAKLTVNGFEAVRRLMANGFARREGESGWGGTYHLTERGVKEWQRRRTQRQ